MISVDRSIEVNPAGTPPEDVLTREEVWRGLVHKSEYAVPYVEEITECRVIERDATGFIREAVIAGETVREHITHYPQERIVFKRLTGSIMGTIQNCIETSPSGDLMLRFIFDFDLPGADAAVEKALADAGERSYLNAVNTTLARVREQKREAVKAD